jgi:DNA-binding beta-propeller fold protein YncE
MNSRPYLINRHKSSISQKWLHIIFLGIILTVLNNCLPAWGNRTKMKYSRLDSIIFRVIKIECITFGGRGSGPGQFLRPSGVTFDASRDRILISDRDNHRIQAFNADGIFISSFGTRGEEPGHLYHPWGLATSPDGTLIVVGDCSFRRIQLFTAEGQFLRQFRISVGHRHPQVYQGWDLPGGIAFSPNGNLLFLLTPFSLRISFYILHSFPSRML